MDSFHYSTGKYYEILNIYGIIEVAYRKGNETDFKDYKEFITSHNCRLVGD